MPLDGDSYWIQKYVLVSNLYYDGACLYRIFRVSEHFQFLSSDLLLHSQSVHRLADDDSAMHTHAAETIVEPVR
jgi:hypothetical protein